jgi:hypothetical protein
MAIILILAGIALFGLSFLYFLQPAGYIMMFSGFLFFMLGLKNIKTKKKETVQKVTEERVVNIAEESRVPTRNCANPDCGMQIRVDVNHCPHCGWKYRYFHSMKILRPVEDHLFEKLVSDLSARTKKSSTEIAKKLTDGMLMRYSDMEILLESKSSFEKFGCDVQMIQSLTVFKPMKYDNAIKLINNLVKQTGRSPDELSRLLENGMVFKYSSRETMTKSRKAFEEFGCMVKPGELIPSN